MSVQHNRPRDLQLITTAAAHEQMRRLNANREFAKQIGITFPILSDFKRTVVKDYGVFNEEQGFGNRATFLIDKEGIIRHIDEGNVAIDPTTVIDACNVLQKKKASQ